MKKAISPNYIASPTRAGFTLIEISIAILVIGVLGTIGYVSYNSVVNKARLVQAMGDIKAIAVAVDFYESRNGVFPGSLSSVGMDNKIDPWETSYVYIRINDPGAGGPRSHQGVPINTDYELYSHGVDGLSSAPLAAAEAVDDIVRAGNGGFLGLASNFNQTNPDDD